jgi:hypothetical protein
MSGEGERGRWVDLPPGSPGLEAEAGGLLRRASQSPPPPPESLARVQRRLFWSPRATAPRGRGGGWLRWAVVGAVLLGSGGVVFARFWEDLRGMIAPPLPRPTRAVQRSRAPAPESTPALPPPRPRSRVTPPRDTSRRAPPGRAPAPRRTVAVAPPRVADPAPLLLPIERLPVERPRADDPVVVTPGPLAEEAALLSEALAQLHQHANPAAALATIELHRRRHPRGGLRADAERVRIDALLLLGRSAEALAAIEAMPPDLLATGFELRLLRAELRAPGSCAAALRDFDWLLSRRLPPPLVERALYGQAGCHLRLGDRAAARQDLERYRARFPEGRFIDDVSRQLRNL